MPALIFAVFRFAAALDVGVEISFIEILHYGRLAA
jgi:hypothetical protein